MVKRAFQRLEREGQVRILTKKIIEPTLDEIQANPRARSAKMRVAERIDAAAA
jgi:16S rRNA (cytosine1402-N4)-methyltransferase